MIKFPNIYTFVVVHLTTTKVFTVATICCYWETVIISLLILLYKYHTIHDSYNKVIYNCFTRNMNMMWLRSMEKIIKSNNLVKHPLYCLYDTFGNGFLSIVCWTNLKSHFYFNRYFTCSPSSRNLGWEYLHSNQCISIRKPQFEEEKPMIKAQIFEYFKIMSKYTWFFYKVVCVTNDCV